jgi:zinc protease
MKIIPLTALLAASLLASGAASAQKETAPAPGAPRDFKVPAASTFTLDNGLEVTMVPFGSMPKVAIELSVRAGNVDEAPDQVWLADMTAHLLQEGTETRSATEMSLAAARMGGSLDVQVDPERTEIKGEVLSELGPEMVKLIADVVERPKLPDSEVPRLKADLQRTLSVMLSQPRTLADQKLASLLYPGHAYGRYLPTPEMIEGFTTAKVRGFHEAFFGAARSHLYVAGRFDRAAMEASIRAAFSGWKRGAAPAPVLAKPTSARAIHVIDRPAAVQSVVLIALPVIDISHPDAVKLQVANTLLGGYFSSRITSNIREQKGYTYSPYSDVSNRYRTSYWAQSAEVTTSVTGPALKEIFLEIDRLQAEAPAEAELRAVKSYMLGDFVLSNSTRNNIINQLELVDLHGLPKDYLATYVSRVLAVTPEDVRQVTAKYLDDAKMTIVIAGDRKVIVDQIKPFGEIK